MMPRPASAGEDPGVPGSGDREGLGHHLPATSYLQGSRCDPLHQLLEGHSEAAISVAFSPTGK